MQRLPDLVLLSIFEHLPIEERLTARNVCRRWNRLLELKVLRRSLDFTASVDFLTKSRIIHDVNCERKRDEQYDKCYCTWRRAMKLFRYGDNATRYLRLPKCIDVDALGWLMHHRYVNLVQLDVTLRNFESEVDFCNFPKRIRELTIRREAGKRLWIPIHVDYLQDVRRLTLENANLCRGKCCSTFRKMERVHLFLIRCRSCERLQRRD